MTNAQTIYEAAIALMDSMSDTGNADVADNNEYKHRTLPILNILRGELYPFSDTYEIDDEGRPIVNLIRDFTKPIDLDDYICQSVMPYGLAAHLLLQEDPAAANFCQQRYDELKMRLSVGMPTLSADVEDVYGSNGGIDPYNEFAQWG